MSCSRPCSPPSTRGSASAICRLAARCWPWPGNRALHGREGDAFVQAAEPVAFDVEGDEAKAGGTDGAIDLRGHFRLDGARHLVAAQFDAREFPVVPHPKDAEPQRPKSRFRVLDR